MFLLPSLFRRWLVLCLFAPMAVAHAAYDPLAVPTQFQPRAIDLVVADVKRQRELPIRVMLPATLTPAPVVIFSHGLGGSREGSAFLGRHWAARGYVTVYLQHPGSDAEVWREQAPARRMQALRQAANGKNLMLRIGDVPALIDQLERWNRESGHLLAGRLDLTRIGMSGHSFGAITTQAVSGQRWPGERTGTSDRRIKAAIAFSPSSPRAGNVDQAFGRVSIPWLLMTGTRDVAQIGNIDLASRLAVYPALPAGGKYELVLEGAEHSAFTDRSLPSESGQRNPNHHRAILAISTAFWDASLKELNTARIWLDGDGPRSVLQTGDRWQYK